MRTKPKIQHCRYAFTGNRYILTYNNNISRANQKCLYWFLKPSTTYLVNYPSRTNQTRPAVLQWSYPKADRFRRHSIEDVAPITQLILRQHLHLLGETVPAVGSSRFGRKPRPKPTSIYIPTYLDTSSVTIGCHQARVNVDNRITTKRIL
jgi:hypothetical protein